MTSQTSAMLLGALVADAASLGLHWLYDADRIASVVHDLNGQSAFAPVDAAYFEDAMGYFAHAGRRSGMMTQYGEVLWLAIQSINDNGGAFDVAAYSAAFTAHFGAGGTYQGYIDRPTRAALDNITNDQTPSGIDDDQNPAVARLPAIFAAYRGKVELPEMLSASMQVTNVNDVAAAYSTVFADVLERVMAGSGVSEALEAAGAAADPTIAGDLDAALSSGDANSTNFAGKVGRACHLPTAGPVMFHILKHSATYQEAVERNILAGGDSAGRSIMIGAIMGAAHGIAKPNGIPLAWILHLEDAADIWAGCEELGHI